jgi:hypothetical protein
MHMPLEDFSILVFTTFWTLAFCVESHKEDKRREESRRFQRLEKRRIRRIGTIWEA